MNWDAIGAIGETVGALAVLITLIYLASQIRQSNRIGRTSSEAEFRVMAQTVNRIILETPDGDPFLEELLKEEPNFTPPQRAKAIQFARSQANLWAFADSSYRNKLMDEFAYQGSIEDMRVVLDEYPGLAVAFKYLVEEYGIKKWGEVSPMWKKLILELDKRGHET